jgi:hypothetical protein
MPTHDRLYKKGYESLREKAIREYEKKQIELDQSLRKSSPNRTSFDPNRSYHRGKPAETALYELHTEILRHKQEAIT